MGDVERLPTQHPRHPHCPSCGADVPTFANASLSMGEADRCGATLLALTFHIQCACGQKLNIRREIVRPT